jgi:UDP-sulfoquinovose synthase
MRILILGGDGYLGWPTAMQFAAQGHEVLVADNYLRRAVAQQTRSEALIANPNLNARAELFEALTRRHIEVRIGDCADFRFLEQVVSQFVPEAIIHYAEQPSAPYSMIGFPEAKLTLNNNLNVTFNVIWAVLTHAPDCHIVKLGTMGEYGTPNIDIEEGWIEIEHKGRKEKFLYPRQAGSLYHTTKVLDTDLLWFYVRTHGLRVTDLMQGPVYGLSTDEADLDERLMPNFHYDDIFGTVVNRFLVQAVAGAPLTVYGKGGQVRGYLNLRDTLQCVALAAEKPAAAGEMRIFNQLTEVFSVNELAERVQRVGCGMGLDVRVQPIANPRKEKEEHYYNPVHSGLLELGLKPHFMTDEVLAQMLSLVLRYQDRIEMSRIMPRVSWNVAIQPGNAARTASQDLVQTDGRTTAAPAQDGDYREALVDTSVTH